MVDFSFDNDEGLRGKLTTVILDQSKMCALNDDG